MSAILLAGLALMGANSVHAATKVYAKDFGYNTQDATAALQGAIDSGADEVVVSNMGSDWIVKPIFLKSNQKITFEAGTVVQAMRGQFHGTNDSLFSADHQSNITIDGNGAILKMHREDYTNAALYSYSQWRHVFYFMSCDNVTVENLTTRDSGGDGVFIGSYGGQAPCTNFHVTNITSDNNYRQGISVTNAKNCLVENCLLKNTWGQEPEAGIDFEPDDATMQLVNCVVRNCRMENNNAAGVLIYPQMMNSGSVPLSITIQNCYITSATGWGVQYSPAWANGVGGTVTFDNCVIESVKGPGIFTLGKYAYNAQLVFKRCTWRDTAQDIVKGLPANPFLLSGQFPDQAPEYGGLSFEDCLLEDGQSRPFIKTLEPSNSSGVANIKGTLTVLNENGATMDLGVKAHDIDLKVETQISSTRTVGAQPVTTTADEALAEGGTEVGDGNIGAGEDSAIGATTDQTRSAAAAAASARVYPNPAIDRLYVRFSPDQEENAEVRIYTLAGDLATRAEGRVSPQQPALACDLHLAPGVYLYQAQCGGRTDKGKVCIVKRK